MEIYLWFKAGLQVEAVVEVTGCGQERSSAHRENQLDRAGKFLRLKHVKRCLE